MKNLTIKTKMVLGGFIIIAAFVISVFFSIAGLNEVHEANGDIRAVNRLQLQVAEIELKVASGRIAALRYTSTQNNADKELFLQRLKEASETVQNAKIMPHAQEFSNELSAILTSVDHYKNAYQGRLEAKTDETVAQALENMNSAGKEINKNAEIINNKLHHLRDTKAKYTEEEVADTKFMTILVSIIGVLLASIIGFLIARSVIVPTQRLAQFLTTIVHTGDFSATCHLEGKDEIAQMGHAFSDLLHFIRQSIADITLVMNAMAAGDFKQRVTAALPGDLGALKNQVNTSLEQLSVVIDAVVESTNAMNKGNFTHQASVRAQGDFATIVESINTVGKQLNASVGAINTIMVDMTQGKFDSRISLMVPGDLDKLKQAINSSLTNIEAAFAEIGHVLNAQAQGDLTLRVNGNYAGQLARLKDTINDTASGLETTVNQILEVAHQVSQAAHEIAQGNQDLSHRTQEQAASLEETASAMEEMTAGIRHSAEGTQHATRKSTDAAALSSQGSGIVTEAVSAMNGLSQSSSKIEEFVAIIDTIAFQTNLLALNAAVEAARAGEQGRGFAVVAGEVRALAGKSSDAAREIKALIDGMTSQVQAGTSLVNETGKSLSDINIAASEVNELVEGIARSSREQAVGVDQVNKAIIQMDHATQQNASLVEELSAAANGMSAQARTLSEVVSRFKTSSSGQSRHSPAPARQVAKAPAPATTRKPAALAAPNSNKSDEWGEF